MAETKHLDFGWWEPRATEILSLSEHETMNERRVVVLKSKGHSWKGRTFKAYYIENHRETNNSRIFQRNWYIYIGSLVEFIIWYSIYIESLCRSSCSIFAISPFHIQNSEQKASNISNLSFFSKTVCRHRCAILAASDFALRWLVAMQHLPPIRCDQCEHHFDHVPPTCSLFDSITLD